MCRALQSIPHENTYSYSKTLRNKVEREIKELEETGFETPPIFKVEFERLNLLIENYELKQEVERLKQVVEHFKIT